MNQKNKQFEYNNDFSTISHNKKSPFQSVSKQAKNRKITQIAHKLGLSGNAGHRAIGNALKAHFNWTDINHKQAFDRYMLGNYVITGIAAFKPMSHPLIGRPEYSDFYKSDAWRKLRYEVLKKYGAVCLCCGAKAGNGVVIHVDHIKPRSRYPALELSFDNLQPLCEDCNTAKSHTVETDWRKS